MRLIIIILIFFSFKNLAQSQVTFEDIDFASYEQFIQNDFENIKETGKTALENNIDYYFLRMRLGIVGYNHQKYEYALPHFEKAYEFYPADTLVQEYLYYAYLFTNRPENAAVFAEKMNESFRKKVAFKKKKIDAISLGFSAFLNDNIDKKRDLNLTDKYNNGSHAVINGSTYGQNLLILKTLKNPRFHIYNKFSIFQTESLAMFQRDTNAFDRKIEVNNVKNVSNLHFQNNFGLTYMSQKDFFVSAACGFFQTSTSEIFIDTVESSKSDVKYGEIDLVYKNISISSSIGKRFRYFTPLLSVTYSNLFKTDSTKNNQFQGEFSLTYFPFKTRNIYFGTSFALLKNYNRDTLQKIFTQKIGFKCNKWLWIAAKFSLGNHSNYMTDNGFNVYNTFDPIHLNTGFDLHFFRKKLELILSYSFQRKEGYYEKFQTLTNVNVVTKVPFNYSNNNISTTLKWNF